MKVLFLPDYSAANAYQRELAAALRRQGVTVAADPTRRRRLLPVLEAVRAHGRPDLVHLHWTEPYIARGGRLSLVKARRTLVELSLLRRAGVRLVWTAHDLFRHDLPEDAGELAFMRGLFGRAGAVIVHCAAAADALLQRLALPASEAWRLRVIPHGHYADAYPRGMTRAEARERLGLPQGSRVLAFVGWVRAYKGVDALLEEFAALPDLEARLVVAGRATDPGYADLVTTLAERDRRVTLRLGFVPDEELQVHLAAADAVVAPYREIFTSGSVLLAMSFGRPVVAPRRGCVAETLHEAEAILYDPEDPAGLRGALRAALDRSPIELERMGRHALERLPELSWDRVAEATASVYREVSGRATG